MVLSDNRDNGVELVFRCLHYSVNDCEASRLSGIITKPLIKGRDCLSNPSHIIKSFPGGLEGKEVGENGRKGGGEEGRSEGKKRRREKKERRKETREDTHKKVVF